MPGLDPRGRARRRGSARAARRHVDHAGPRCQHRRRSVAGRAACRDRRWSWSGRQARWGDKAVLSCARTRHPSHRLPRRRTPPRAADTRTRHTAPAGEVLRAAAPRTPSRGWTSNCRGTGRCRRRTGRGSGWSPRPASPRSPSGSGTPRRRRRSAPTSSAPRPRELTRAISLRQTVEMVRTTIEVMESAIDEVAAPGDEAMLREALLVYAREIAFATAQVYAQAAEARGAWDARLESLVVNAVLSGEADEGVLSRAAALGWSSPEQVVRGAGHRAGRRQRADRRGDPAGRPARQAPGADRGARQPAGGGRRRLRRPDPGREGADRPVRGGPGGGRPGGAATCWRPPAPRRRPRPGCGPVPRGRTRPARCSRTICCRSGRWPATRRPASSWWRRSTDRWRRPGPRCWRRSASIWSRRPRLEGAARMLFVHPNTVRYRLRRVTDVTGWSPSDVRSAFTLRIALILGRLSVRRSSFDLDVICGTPTNHLTVLGPCPHGRRTASRERECEGARTRRSRPGCPDARLPQPLARTARCRRPVALVVGRRRSRPRALRHRGGRGRDP